MNVLKGMYHTIHGMAVRPGLPPRAISEPPAPIRAGRIRGDSDELIDGSETLSAAYINPPTEWDLRARIGG